jgi:hypothetical protein
LDPVRSALMVVRVEQPEGFSLSSDPGRANNSAVGSGDFLSHVDGQPLAFGTTAGS